MAFCSSVRVPRAARVRRVLQESEGVGWGGELRPRRLAIALVIRQPVGVAWVSDVCVFVGVYEYDVFVCVHRVCECTHAWVLCICERVVCLCASVWVSDTESPTEWPLSTTAAAILVEPENCLRPSTARRPRRTALRVVQAEETRILSVDAGTWAQLRVGGSKKNFYRLQTKISIPIKFNPSIFVMYLCILTTCL